MIQINDFNEVISNECPVSDLFIRMLRQLALGMMIYDLMQLKNICRIDNLPQIPSLGRRYDNLIKISTAFLVQMV